LTKKVSFMRKNYYLSSFLLLVFTTGCSLILGNIKPTDEKSNAYSYLDLSSNSRYWIKTREELNSSGQDKTDLDQSDVTFKRRSGKATISINSVCKKTSKKPDQGDLKKSARELLLGFSQLEILSEKQIKVSHHDAYEITAQGLMNHSSLVIKLVLLEKNSCSYDLIYISESQEFKKHETDFQRFVSSFELKS